MAQVRAVIHSRRERRLLEEIDSEMSAADPRLAAMLATFTRLAAGEPVPSHRLGRHHGLGLRPGAAGRAWAVMALAFALIAGLITFGALSASSASARIVPFAVTCVTGSCRANAGIAASRLLFPQH
jgi:hypothetical protein